MKPTTSAPLLVRRTAGGEVYVTATLSPEGILLSEWRGFVTPEQIQTALLELLELQVQHKVHRVLNDLTHVTGTWSQAIPWLATDFQTLLRQKLAHSRGAIVLGNSVFSNLSAQQMVAQFPSDEKFQTELFPSPEAALLWLRKA